MKGVCMEVEKKQRFRDTRHSTTINISNESYQDMQLYLLQRRKLTQERMTQQQFIETAIMRELARVRGENPEEIQEAPNYQVLARQRRMKRDE
jgi:predicted hydrolase (HD superfamily)